MNIFVHVSLFPYERVSLGYRTESRIMCFEVYLKEDSESLPGVFKSYHYSISLLRSGIVRL